MICACVCVCVSKTATVYNLVKKIKDKGVKKCKTKKINFSEKYFYTRMSKRINILRIIISYISLYNITSNMWSYDKMQNKFEKILHTFSCIF